MLTAFAHDLGAFSCAYIFSIAGTELPRSRKRASRAKPHFVSHGTDRRADDLLQRGRPKKRADASPVARTSLFVANVRAALRPARRSLSPCRARLSGLRTQRLAGREEILVYIRSHCRDHESLRRSAWVVTLHALHAGLRRPGGLSHGLGASRSYRGSYLSGCSCAQRSTVFQLEAPPEI